MISVHTCPKGQVELLRSSKDKMGLWLSIASPEAGVPSSFMAARQPKDKVSLEGWKLQPTQAS